MALWFRAISADARVMRRSLVLSALSLLALAPSVAAAPPPGSSCPVFPADNVWHADVTGLPVHPSSGAWLAAMGGPDRRLHPDFGPAGPGEQPYGIPYVVVGGGQPKVAVSFEYADESDPGPYPLAADTPLEGGSDRHALMIDRDACKLYELFATTWDPATPSAGSGAVWDLRSNALRPAGWTSADAAGLPIFAGLVRRDEVAAGNIDHAIRITASRTDRSYLWPARHHAGAARDPNLPPMGARFRLKSSYDISRFRADTQVVLRAMQRHGVILADNGSNWYFTGTSEQGWDTAMLDELKSVPAGQFEAVDASSLMVSPDSGQMRGAAAAPAPSTTAAPTPAPPATTTTRPAPRPTSAPATTTTAVPTTTTVATIPAPPAPDTIAAAAAPTTAAPQGRPATAVPSRLAASRTEGGRRISWPLLAFAALCIGLGGVLVRTRRR